MGELTRAGWPRPIVNGFPVPWVSPSDKLAEMDTARAAACASGAICAVCGGDYGDDEPAYVLVQSAEKPLAVAEVDVQAMDNGILHKRCLQLALARCPKLRSLHAGGLLLVVRTSGNSARPTQDQDGGLKAVLDGATCALVNIDGLRHEG